MTTTTKHPLIDIALIEYYNISEFEYFTGMFGSILCLWLIAYLIYNEIFKSAFNPGETFEKAAIIKYSLF